LKGSTLSKSGGGGNNKRASSGQSDQRSLIHKTSGIDSNGGSIIDKADNSLEVECVDLEVDSTLEETSFEKGCLS